MKTKYPIHPDFKNWQNMHPPLNKIMLPIIQTSLKLLFKQQKSNPQIDVKRYLITTNDTKIRALLYCPKDINNNAPCLIYYHGGGFVLPGAPYHYKLVQQYALKAKCKVLFVEYRLAPKYPFPCGVNDCYQAYLWVRKHHHKLGINQDKIIVAGDSAGAQLATVVCLKAKDNMEPMPIGQMLVYPVTAHNLQTKSMQLYTDTPMCNSKDIQKYSHYYLQDSNLDKLEYYSPYHCNDLSGLPTTYIETAEFDCLKDEGILYAKKLESFNVLVELYNTVGTMHGYDIVLNSDIVKNSIEKRIDFLNRIFN